MTPVPFDNKSDTNWFKCEPLTFLTIWFFRQLGLEVDHIGPQISKIMKIFLLKCSHKIPRMKIQKNSLLINHDDNSSKDDPQ